MGNHAWDIAGRRPSPIAEPPVEGKSDCLASPPIPSYHPAFKAGAGYNCETWPAAILYSQKGTAMSFRILVADQLAKEGLDFLKASGIEFDEKIGLKPAESAPLVGLYDALIVRSAAKVTKDVLANPGKLKAIARAGVGVDNIDLPSATSKGILVMNTAEASTLSTAEHACLAQ